MLGNQGVSENQAADSTARLVSRARWGLTLRGVIGVIAGLMAIALPGMALSVFMTIAGVYFIGDGIVALASGMKTSAEGERFWPFMLEGALSIAAGILAFRRPGAFAVGVAFILALRFITTGGAELAMSRRLNKLTGVKDWALWLAGGASILFGLLLLVRPSVGLASLIVFAGVYALLFGGAMLGASARLRTAEHHLHV